MKKKSYCVDLLSILLGLICVVLVLSFAFGENRLTEAFAEEKGASFNVIDMDSDEFYYNGQVYSIDSYDDILGSSMNIVPEENSGILKVFGDDAIVSLIPKDRFLSVGSYLSIGREWG